MGMRAMQERVWQHRGEQYLLLKSPPASGKSRALMFVAPQWNLCNAPGTDGGKVEAVRSATKIRETPLFVPLMITDRGSRAQRTPPDSLYSRGAVRSCERTNQNQVRPPVGRMTAKIASAR